MSDAFYNWEEDADRFANLDAQSEMEDAATDRAHGRDNNHADHTVALPEDGISESLFDDNQEDGSEIRLDHEWTGLPEVWRDADGLDQRAITQQIRNRHQTATESVLEYEQKKPRTLLLSDLRQIYEAKDQQAAVEILQRKWNLRIDKDFAVPNNSPDYQWASVSIHLDYRFAMGNGIGLHAAMPNTSIPEVASDPNWVFWFSTTSRSKPFRGSRAAFGCEVAGRALMIGHTPANEEVFLVLVAEDTLRRPLPEVPGKFSKAPTVMPAPLARAMLAMIAYMMKKSNYRSVDVPLGGYPSLASEEEFASGCTSLLDNAEWDITLKEMIALNDTLMKRYKQWIRKAPQEYKDLTDLCDLVPTAVVIRYGQNRQIDTGEDVVDLANQRYWETAVDYSQLRTFEAAFAQHLRYSPVDQWGPIPSSEIRLANPGPLFKSAQRRPEDLITNLARYELHDDDGNERPVYTEDGQRVPRVVAKYMGGVPRCCGILQKLSNLDSLFEDEDKEEDEDSNDEVSNMLGVRRPHARGSYIDDEDEAGIPRRPRRPRPRFPGLRYDAYPHAFLSNYGQWQAKGVISPFSKLLYPITDDASRFDDGAPVVQPISSQCYNTFAHKTQESARLHIAQRGLLTATVAGAWATTPKGNTTFRRLYTQSDYTLPHLRLESQIKNISETYLRFENVLRIHCSRMTPETLTGPGFYQHVIRPILDAYYDPDVVDKVRSQCLVLRPEVYPNVYLWTSYPIVTLLKSFWTFYAQPSLRTRYEGVPGLDPRSVQHSAVQRLSDAPDHYVLEMIAVLERLLNFCHTGLAKALTHTLMSRLWPSRAILEGYFPFFWSGLSFSSSNAIRPVLNLAQWPLDVKTGKPLCASLRSQEFTYGAAHVETYKAHFQIRCMMACTVHNNDDNVSMLDTLCGLVMDAFVADIIDLVGEAIDVIKTTLKDNPSHPEAKWINTRCARFKLWRASEHPLDYGEEHNTLDLLCQAVSNSLREAGKSLPKSAVGKCSVRDFVDRLYTIGMGTTQQSITAPVYAKGSTPYALRLALAEAHRQLGHDTPLEQREEAIKVSLRAAVIRKEIHFFPDRIGDRTRVPSIHAWTRMGKSDGDARGGEGRALSEQGQVAREFFRRADEEQLQDVYAHWSLNDVTLGQYSKYMKSEVLPDEWKSENANDATTADFDFTKKVYIWAEKRFTDESQHWQCHLAKALAFLHTSALPQVCMPHGTTSQGKHYAERFASITKRHAHRSINLAREMPLHTKSKNGFTNRGIYFTVAATVYLGWIDPKSPIHKEIKNSKSGTLPEKWTSKHTAKGLTVPILIRFGIAEGWGSSVLHSPKKGDHFRVRSQDALQKWETDVSAMFKKGSQGAYRLAEMVLGAETAERLDEADEFPGLRKRSAPRSVEPRRPPPALRRGAASSSRRRSSRSESEGESD